MLVDVDHQSLSPFSCGVVPRGVSWPTRFVLPINAPIIGFRIRSNLILPPFNLITSTNTPFTSKTTFTGVKAPVLILWVVTPFGSPVTFSQGLRREGKAVLETKGLTEVRAGELGRLAPSESCGEESLRPLPLACW